MSEIWGNLLKVVPWVSVWHPNMNFSTPFSILKSLWTLINIFPQYLKIIMCKLPDFFGGRSQDVHFRVCHTLTFCFKCCFLYPKMPKNGIFTCFVRSRFISMGVISEMVDQVCTFNSASGANFIWLRHFNPSNFDCKIFCL